MRSSQRSDDSIQKIIVGVGRIAEVGEQVFYETNGDKRLPVWARRLSQAYPEEGVRIPYQEYVRAGLPTDTIRCDVPANARSTFSFVAEHLTDDDAVAILERVIQSIETVRSEAKIPGDWKRQLAWLNKALSDVWINRGAFPGIGSVLRFLGFEQAFSFQREILVPMAQKGNNPLEYVRALLSGEKKPKNASYAAGIAKAQNEWKRGEGRQALLEQLMRFQISPDQVERIVNPDLRQDSGITAEPKDIVENPYLIAEQDRGHKKSNPIALETIDQGMLPEGEAVRFMGEDPIRPDDQRRVRAVCHSVLKEAARDAGDTVVTLPDLMAKVRDRFPEKRRCAPDPEIFIAEKAFNEAIMEIATADEFQVVGLKQLSALEQHIASVIRRRVAKNNPDPKQVIDWRKALESPQVFGTPKTNREKAAIDEKEAALKKLFSRRVSVLTGGAGTGKTSVIRVLLHVLEKVDGKKPMLLLAPTGKARVRLATRTKRLANTIHQFLLRQDWIVPPSFALKSNSSKPPESATTVVIDECSMIPTDLFGTLLKAVDTNQITRLVLVGDPNQLPPIGPGRPFVDIVDWFEREHPENIAHLVTAMRAEEVSEGGQVTTSTALDFANGFRTTDAAVDDDELLSSVARGESRGDLVSLFWADYADLTAKLTEVMQQHLGIEPGKYASLNASFGYTTDQKDFTRSEAWQIISPTRIEPYGTEDLNRQIQQKFKIGLIKECSRRGSGKPKPFGDCQIVWSDKVMQLRNRKADAWPQTGDPLNYVANGEIGLVDFTGRTAKGSDYLKVVFSTQPKHNYSYWRNEAEDLLEPAYALTVHKSQGSDFEVVILIVPQSATHISRELIYTGLTRFRKKLILLIEKDIRTLIEMRKPESSATRLRNTHMFHLALRPGPNQAAFNEPRIHRTSKGVAVRSKSEVVVAEILENLGVSFKYEQPLFAPGDSKDFRLPDFTIGFEGDVFYWEHLGMLSVSAYADAWNRKLEWYRANGFQPQLITSIDGPNGSIDAQEIERTARRRILQEK